MPNPAPFVRDSVEYFKFSLIERDGKDLTTATVQCAIEPRGDTDPTWIGCTWETGNTWRTNVPLAFSAANYPGSTHFGWARVVDAPETPWVNLGPIVIKER